MRGRTEDSVGSQAGEHLLAWPWEGSIILVGWEGVWSHFIWGKVVSATVALFSALGTDGLKASILVIETLRRLVKNWSKEMTGPLAYLIIQTTHVFAKKSNHSIHHILMLSYQTSSYFSVIFRGKGLGYVSGSVGWSVTCLRFP